MKRQSTEANTKIDQILKLFCKDFKAVILKMIQQETTKALETNEEVRIPMKGIKKNQMEIEMKNISEI